MSSLSKALTLNAKAIGVISIPRKVSISEPQYNINSATKRAEWVIKDWPAKR